MSSEVPRHARVVLPSWLYGGDPSALLDEANVEVRRDRATGEWTVQTSESYLRQDPNLISYRHIAGPTVHQEDFAYLSSRTDLIEHLSDESTDRQVQKWHEELERTRNPVHALELIRIDTLTVPTHELGARVEHHFRDLREIGVESDPDQKVFANAGVHLMERSEALTWRFKLPMMLAQISQDERMQAGDITHLMRAFETQHSAFRTALGLSDGLFSMDAYLGPLLGALAPSVWGFAVPRTFGTVVYSLGQPLAGTTGRAEEMLHLIGVPGANRALAVPQLAPAAAHSAINWWATALDRMFGVLSNFAVFTGRDGIYRADKHMQAILTVEQLFRRTASALTSDRDINARRVLAFTALDTVDRLTAVKLEKLADPRHASKTLQRMRDELPSAGAEVLLDAAGRSVQALHELRDGFFVHKLLGSSQLRLVYGDGSTLAMDQDDATAFYVKALRDATHGHGSNKANARDRTAALLAQHDGNVPHDIGLLPLLYLVEILATPGRLRQVLHTWSRSS
ncbi:hypothetical protein [Nocardioides zeicaulis]|uniref:Uncharacterized protein n=1 Tax=Nocardioides zeicaulis TaxID=1776857 RepID=A0ABV6DWU1_9ACTN